MKQSRILFVDDDVTLRQLVRDQLTTLGYAMEEADDGISAMEKLQAGNFDLMILDINMPGKSGIDVLKFIKDKSMNCRVIMLTGRVGFNVATESLKLGADEYITKPFNLEYLNGAIKRVLAKT